MLLLNLSGITKRLDGNPVLENIHFSQQQFQKIAIAGATGAGKTTLLKIIAGLIQPDAGSVMFERQKVLGPDEKLIPGHNGIGYISQNFELRNNYKVAEELAYTNQLTNEAATTIFETCRISHLLKRWTDELSGGEKQRIVTARALIASPRLLLLDEPFSNLDMEHTQTMKMLINDITEKLQITCILVSHDPLDILSWADRVLVLENGELVQSGDPRQIYLKPINEYTARLFGKYNLITQTHAPLFAGLPGILMNGKDMLIRPEHFKIVKAATTTSVKGIVKKIYFFGSYLEIDVWVEEMMILIRTGVIFLEENDVINITLGT